jgi:hypothetical protein
MACLAGFEAGALSFGGEAIIARRHGPFLPPEILEPVRRQFSVAHGVLNVAMAKIRLQGAGVMAGIGEGEAAGVAQHVRVRLEIQTGFRTGSLDHLGEACRPRYLPIPLPPMRTR